MASPPIVEDSDITARRAKMRIGVAVVLLAVAIGGLALLSRHKPEQPAEEPAPSGKQESMSSSPAGSEAPAQMNSAQQEPPPAPSAPEVPAEQATEPPPPPPPPAPVVSKLAPETTHSAAPATPTSVSGEKTKPEKPAPLAPQQTKQEQPQAKPAQQPAAEKSTPTPAPHKAEPKAYEVQVGVFTDMENAKQLQAKLAEHGIPSHTETKLQVGPFANKAEADAAQVKLKALGMGAVIVPGK